MMRPLVVAILLSALSAASATVVLGQTPQPFPSPGAQPPAPPSSPEPAAPPPAAAPAEQPPAPVDPDAPTEEAVGFPIYPTARFLASYDAGMGQRYYVFGTTATFEDLVAYYRSRLRERGNLVFREPPTHMFEVGRYRSDAIAFPPGVTIKDWTWGGLQGYPNPTLGADPARFPSIIVIVPPPAGTR